MIHLIMGLKGSGKTKKLIDAIHTAVNDAHGDVVCIEKRKSLTYDIPYQVRLVEASAYGISTNALLYGFLCGLHAGNYDITNVFIDDFYKLLDDRSNEAVEKLLDDLAAFAQRENVNFTIMASADPNEASEGIRTYF